MEITLSAYLMCELHVKVWSTPCFFLDIAKLKSFVNLCDIEAD